jgi:uncharacterized membrane protein (DUF2068 family)
MRLVPRSWHNETWICSIRRHSAPAAQAARLREEDRCLGRDAGDGTRFSRCLRCDLWILAPVPPASAAAYDVVPPLADLDLPQRGKPLEDAILLRLIALDRGVHAVIFGLLTVALVLVELRLPLIRSWAESLASGIKGLSDAAPAGGHAFLSRQLGHLTALRRGQVGWLLVTAVAYGIVEGVEAVFLWKERRWAEYLTVVAIVGLIPFEIHELIHRLTIPRVAALVINVAVFAWLIWNKRLFGLRGGHAALREGVDWQAVLAHPVARPDERTSPLQPRHGVAFARAPGSAPAPEPPATAAERPGTPAANLRSSAAAETTAKESQ